jgi:Fe-Mn family superoxide dismutase
MGHISRRQFIQGTAALAATYSLSSAVASATTQFSLPPLPYDPAALEPSIDSETMKIHHGRHHQTYVDKLNEQVTKNPALAALTLDEINKNAATYSDAVRNNEGGHFNHSFFWKIMAAQGKGGEPSKDLLARIQSDFGGLDAMKDALNAAALGRFGSGWGWLVLTDEKKLAVCATPYQDNPAMNNAETKGMPLIGIDVWEHAYYLKYQNRRVDYLKSWWSIVNWNEVNKRFAA